jgi:hypothetical protein
MPDAATNTDATAACVCHWPDLHALALDVLAERRSVEDVDTLVASAWPRVRFRDERVETILSEWSGRRRDEGPSALMLAVDHRPEFFTVLERRVPRYRKHYDCIYVRSMS